MKLEQFPGNRKDLRVTYCRTREGPNGFIIYQRDASTMQLDPLEAWRSVRVAKNSDIGEAVKAWCLEMHEKYGNEVKPDVDPG